MKKRLSSVMTLALGLLFSACSSQEEIAPSAGIGYMTLGEVTADVTTRAAQTVSDMSKWQVTVNKSGGENAFTGTAAELSGKGFDADKNPYTVTASNYANEAAALLANSNWGDAFYTGSETGVNIEAGKTTNVSITCGKAQNARLGVTFNESFTAAVAPSYALKVEKTDVSEGLTFDAQNAKDKYAYYAAEAEVNYTLTYTFNSEQKEVKGSVTLGGAATQKTLNVMLNSNGKIDLTITYDDEFTPTNEDITIDGATGEKTGE